MLKNTLFEDWFRIIKRKIIKVLQVAIYLLFCIEYGHRTQQSPFQTEAADCYITHSERN